MSDLESTYLNCVWDVLVDVCGALPFDEDRQALVCMAQLGRIEYRFIGSLGFGGKVWVNFNTIKSHVNCYPEDLNAERSRTIDLANRRLASLDALLKAAFLHAKEAMANFPPSSGNPKAPNDKDSAT